MSCDSIIHMHIPLPPVTSLERTRSSKLEHGENGWVTGCRLVLVAIPACVLGVAFITQPEFLADWLGFAKRAQPRSLLGIALASGQVLTFIRARLATHVFGSHVAVTIVDIISGAPTTAHGSEDEVIANACI